MHYHTHHHQNKIMDFLWCPRMTHIDTAELDITPREKKLLADAFDTIQQVSKIFQPFQERIDRYTLIRLPLAFPSILYLHLLEEGHDPKDLDDLYPLFLSLPEDKLKQLFLQMLTDGKIHMVDDTDFPDLLEEYVTTDDKGYKWSLFWAYTHLRETVQEMVSLYKEIAPLYAPYYAQYEKEIRQFEQSLDIDTLYRPASEYDMANLLSASGKDNCHVFVWSPPHFIQLIHDFPQQSTAPIYFFLFPRIASLLAGRQGMEKDKFIVIMKALSDSIRYDILCQFLTGQKKSKEIAEELGTTPANVSFHVQKLVNANLLLFASEKSEIKYKLNTALLRDFVTRIQTDFELEK